MDFFNSRVYSTTRFWRAVSRNTDSATPLTKWLDEFCSDLNLHKLLEKDRTRSADLADLDVLRRLAENNELQSHLLQEPRQAWTLGDFAGQVRADGQVVITTFHGSKGRQFDAVILPGLQEALLPSRRWDRRKRHYGDPDAYTLAEERRLFYVGFTRARRYAILCGSDRFINQWGHLVDLGPSRFILEVEQRLAEYDR